MNKRQRQHRLQKRRAHQQHQRSDKRAALDAALDVSEESKPKLYDAMEEQGYQPTHTGGWRKMFRTRRKQPRKDR